MGDYCGLLELGSPQASRAHAAWPGGEPLPAASDTTWEQPGLAMPASHAKQLQQREAEAAALALAAPLAPPTGGLVCQVAGCHVDLTHCKPYSIKKRACVAHMQADWVCLSATDPTPWRFCQQCGRFELLSKFDEGKRSCRTRLAKRRSGTRAQLLKRNCATRSPSASETAIESAPLPTIQLAGYGVHWHDTNALGRRLAPVRVRRDNSISSRPFGEQKHQQPQQRPGEQQPSLSDGPPAGGASPTLMSAAAQQSLSAPVLKLPDAAFGTTGVRVLEPVAPLAGLFVGGDDDDADGQLAGLSLLEALQRQQDDLEPEQPAHAGALWTQASGIPGAGTDAFGCFEHHRGLVDRCASDELLLHTFSGTSGDSAGPPAGLRGNDATSFTGCSLPLSKLHLDNGPPSPRLLPSGGSCTSSLVAGAAAGSGMAALQTSIAPLGPVPLQAQVPRWPPVSLEALQPRQPVCQLQRQPASAQPATSDPNSAGSGSSGGDSSSSGSGRLKWLLQQVHDEVQRGGSTNELDGLNSAELAAVLHAALAQPAASVPAADAAGTGTGPTPGVLAQHAARMQQLQQQMQQLKQKLAASGDIRSTSTNIGNVGASGAAGLSAEQQLVLLEVHLSEASATMAYLLAQQHNMG